jgi:hypothetical protein
MLLLTASQQKQRIPFCVILYDENLLFAFAFLSPGISNERNRKSLMDD